MGETAPVPSENWAVAYFSILFSASTNFSRFSGSLPVVKWPSRNLPISKTAVSDW